MNHQEALQNFRATLPPDFGQPSFEAYLEKFNDFPSRLRVVVMQSHLDRLTAKAMEEQENATNA